MRQVAFALVFALTACATASVATTPARPPVDPALQASAFLLPAPKPASLGPEMKLWATHYDTPMVSPAPKAISAAFPLIGRDGKWISAPLTHKDWCEAALQGSVSVRDGNATQAYVFVDANGPAQANCDNYLGSLSDGVKLATRRARFMAVSHPQGCGVRNLALMPFRTIAVDPDTIPIGKVVFVPELRGRVFTYNTLSFKHDGYLFAGDRGGAIHGRHIDVFTQGAPLPLEDLFASTDARTFAAYVVSENDPSAIGLNLAQDGHCDEAPVAPK